MIPDPTGPHTWIIESAAGARHGTQAPNAVLVNIHPPTACAGRPCVIHDPSDHHMKNWPLNWRDDQGIMERLCAHQVGHPDPDDAAWRASRGDEDTTHGCDGCCGGGGGTVDPTP